jgi:serine/threonine protein kinase
MQARGTLLPAAQVWKYSQQLSDALMHMHDRKMMHRDIKPANVFLSGSKLGPKLVCSRPPPSPCTLSLTLSLWCGRSLPVCGGWGLWAIKKFSLLFSFLNFVPQGSECSCIARCTRCPFQETEGVRERGREERGREEERETNTLRLTSLHPLSPSHREGPDAADDVVSDG